MSSEETSVREKRPPEMYGGEELLNNSRQLHPMRTWSENSEKSLGSRSSGGFCSSPSAKPAFTGTPQDQESSSMKPIRRFIPPSWKNFFHRWQRQPWTETSLLTYAPEDFKHTQFSEHPQRTTFDGEGSSTDNGNDGDFKEPLSAPATPLEPGKTLAAERQGALSSGPPSYKEKLETYDHKYSYMKSWPGLLRLMAGLELILGGMVFACTAAYIQKDYQWSALYGGNSLPYNGVLGGGYGYNYYGPMTPFVLVVVSLVWLVTVILLGLGVTMYYRTILLDSHWWPLAEFGLNLVMSLLYMAAAIAYVNDVNRGGLCYSVFANNPLVVALCRVEGGQVAAIAFLFLTMLLYLVGSLVCLRMWSHQAAQKNARALVGQMNYEPPSRLVSFPSSQRKPILLRGTPQQVIDQDEVTPKEKVARRVEFSEKGGDPEVLNFAIPTGHHPKPHIVPDYVSKYPAIGSRDEREKYKAVFNDQYAEYKELYDEVRTALGKFKELEAMLSKLPRHYQNQKVESRVSTVWRDYQSKKEDPAFLEKQERCEYLKRKLTHIKAQIQAYDQKTSQGSVYF
ncbi:occludin/ELL domain-containing protein 1 isoform X2 [Podarcis raffonei]|uniref:occludin/ELL domain-containing protein 1 isoform X2 n=1 Tax=Podarcis raffonei TaxID=65483 RepID=UPI00232933CB|nr:occludin/ELL domain-containing protein 1 isoform X2 [Podarcis raffonei]XP_053228469.1 occludin/ELL domain-containing protein 1 isoform X2 [Podarcis raffonei]